MHRPQIQIRVLTNDLPDLRHVNIEAFGDEEIGAAPDVFHDIVAVNSRSGIFHNASQNAAFRAAELHFLFCSL